MHIFKVFKVKKEERWLALVMLVVFITFNVLVIASHYHVYTMGAHGGFWSIFTKNFRISGYDNWSWITISGMRIHFETIRHPLYLTFLYPLYLLDNWLIHTVEYNFAVYFMAAIIVFSLWGTAEMGDLVRGAITSLPKHQFESGQALGLSQRQLYVYIIIPQVLRRLLPQAINLITRMIKTTSLIVLIGVIEVVKVGQQIIDSNRLSIPSAAFWIYGCILLLYFAVCFPISKLSSYLETIWKE